MTPCDHTFCQHCMRQLFESRQQQAWPGLGLAMARAPCPECRAEISSDRVGQATRIVRNRLDKLRVRCPKKCGLVLARGDVEAHYKQCRGSPVCLLDSDKETGQENKEGEKNEEKEVEREREQPRVEGRPSDERDQLRQ